MPGICDDILLLPVGNYSFVSASIPAISAHPLSQNTKGAFHCNNNSITKMRHLPCHNASTLVIVDAVSAPKWQTKLNGFKSVVKYSLQVLKT